MTTKTSVVITITMLLFIALFIPVQMHCYYCDELVCYKPTIIKIASDSTGVYHKECNLNFTMLWSYLYTAKINVRYYELLEQKYGNLTYCQSILLADWKDFEIKCDNLYVAQPLSESTVDKLHMEKFNIEKLEIEPPELDLLKVAQNQIDKELGVER